jgi:lysophospholipase L1-like esterase
MKKLINTCLIAVQLILAICACFACGKEKIMDTPPTTSTTYNGTTATGLQYLGLGDSYTIGQSVQESERFLAQTVKLLASQNVTIKTVKYIAITGWTTANLIDAITSQDLAPNFDIVTLLIGVNDQYQHLDASDYRTRFTALLNTAVKLAGSRPSRVFVVSIPDYSATPYVYEPDKARVSKEIDAFNAINKEITLANKIAYIDITPGSRDAATDLSLVANDGLHPSGKEYAKWAALLAPVIKNALK